MEKLTDSSKLCSFIEDFSNYENQLFLMCNKIEALFDQPTHKTENLENFPSYCTLATSEEVEEVYLNVYCAGSGSAVGGMSDEKFKGVAEALVDYARQTEPINYAYKAYYLDGPTALELGIRGGAPYYNETELRLSEKEFKELYVRLL